MTNLFWTLVNRLLVLFGFANAGRMGLVVGTMEGRAAVNTSETRPVLKKSLRCGERSLLSSQRPN